MGAALVHATALPDFFSWVYSHDNLCITEGTMQWIIVIFSVAACYIPPHCSIASPFFIRHPSKGAPAVLSASLEEFAGGAVERTACNWHCSEHSNVAFQRSTNADVILQLRRPPQHRKSSADPSACKVHATRRDALVQQRLLINLFIYLSTFLIIISDLTPPPPLSIL
jgi:hypothetical protein